MSESEHTRESKQLLHLVFGGELKSLDGTEFKDTAQIDVVGIFPNDAAIVRLVGSQLQEQQEEWQLERRRFFSEATMAKIPQPGELLEFTDADLIDPAPTVPAAIR